MQAMMDLRRRSIAQRCRWILCSRSNRLIAQPSLDCAALSVICATVHLSIARSYRCRQRLGLSRLSIDRAASLMDCSFLQNVDLKRSVGESIVGCGK